MMANINYVVSELLCVLKNKQAAMSRVNIVNAFSEFYTQKEVNEAKQILIEIADKSSVKIDDLKKIKARVGEGKLRRDMEDIYILYTGLVTKDNESLPLIFASDTARIPAFDESISSDLKNAYDSMSTKLNKKLDENNLSISDELKKINTVLSALTADKKEMESINEQMTDLKSSINVVYANSMSMLTRVTDIASVVTGPTSTSKVTAPVQWSLADGSCWSNTKLSHVLQGDPKEHATNGVSSVRLKESLTKRRTVVGKRQSASTTSKLTSSTESKPWHIYTGKLSKETTENDIKSFLEENDIKVIEVRKLKAMQEWQQKSSAFHVSVDISCKDSVMDEKLWPNNIEVRDWFFKPRE